MSRPTPLAERPREIEEAHRARAETVEVQLVDELHRGPLRQHDLMSQGKSHATVPIVCQDRRMGLARWEERLAPLDGIAAVAFWVAGILVLQGPANQPDTDTTPTRAVQFFTTEENTILVGTFLYMIGTLFFLWFLGLVRTRLVEAEGGTTD